MALDRELRHRALELGQHGAVLLGVDVEPVGGNEPAAAGIVLHHEARIAGQEARQVPRRQPRRDVVDAARRGADQHGDGADLVELLDRLRGRVLGGGERDAEAAGQNCNA